MKKAELFFGAILVPIDYLMLVAAGLTAYFLRFHSSITFVQPVQFIIPFDTYIEIVMITAFVWLILFAVTGLYSIRSTRRLISEVRKIFLACSTGVLLIIILFFLERDLFSSRFIILAAYGFAVLYVTIARVIVVYIERQLFRKGIGVHNVVLIGKNKNASMIVNELQQRPSLGLQVKMHFDAFTPKIEQKILEYQKTHNLEELIQTEPNSSKEEAKRLHDFCNEHHIVFKYAAALFDAQSSNISIQPIAGIPIIEVQKTTLDGWGRIVKRIFDIVGSIVLIIATVPIMLLAAIAIAVDSGRPIFFTRLDDGERTTRIGQDGKPFFYFKFRSMQPGMHSMRYTELKDKNMRNGSPLVKIQDDPRITRVGRFIRKFSIDELTEFFLVLKGDMSLVGPRPHLPEEVAQYEQHHKRVLNMKPGITGLAQISGRSDLNFEDEVRLDLFYMENWALWLDIVILLKTPFVLFKKRSAL